MSKKLEAMEALKKVFTYDSFYQEKSYNKYDLKKAFKNEYKSIKKALTPPTEKEVGGELGKCLSPLSYNLKVTNKGISYESDNYGIGWICHFDGEYLSFNSNDLPPRIITIIGRFYEGLQDE